MDWLSRFAGMMPAVVFATALYAVPASALDYQWGDVSAVLKTRVSFGAAWRMEDRDERLIGKTNVPGQQNLCAADDCISFNGDPAPNQRYVNAKGAYLGETYDDGDINYNRGEIVSATGKITPDLFIGWGDFQLKVRGVAFYDTVNAERDDFHTNTIHQPAETRRLRGVDNDLGQDFDFYEAYVGYTTTLMDHNVSITVGNQSVRWGESNFIALNTLNEINPPDENRLWMPGGSINEVFQPVPMVLLTGDLSSNVSGEMFYQYGWKPVVPAAAGGFMSSFEVAGGQNYADISMGHFPEDPNCEHRISGLAGLITSSCGIGRVLKGFGDAKDGGQYGVRLNWFAENLNRGTDLGFYAMNYHSRYPFLGVVAAQDSCLRNSTNFAQATIDCLGFNGSINPLPGGKEPLPFDTIRLFLKYPENLQLYGVSFNTNIGEWSLAGEYAFRPDAPVQVALTDVVMTAAQPAFPRQDIPVVLPQLGTIPSARHFAPDFLSVYRGYDNSDPNHDINGGQVIQGYERMDVGQLDFTGLKTISSSNPIGADQVIVLVEAGATQAFDMPDRKDIQFEGYVLHKNSHASPGADGSGNNGVIDTRRFNPHQQTEGFADDFAWGYRVLARFEYNNVFEGINFKPWLGWYQDVKGIAVGPAQNFIEGRKNFLVGTECDLEGGWSGQLFYYGFTGSNNVVRDRDFLTLSVSYTF